MQINQLHLYPIKSTQAYGVAQAFVQAQGLNFDREFMLTEENGKFISARKDEGLFQFTALPVPLGLQIHHQDGSQRFVAYQDFQQQQECNVWGNQFNAYIAPAEINQWFSAKLGRNVQLRWIGQHSQRIFKHFPEQGLTFVDSCPILLTTIASLNALQAQCATPIQMSQFRPNIVLDGEIAFAEHQWQKLQISNVTFSVVKSCVRCVLTTRDPFSATLHPKMEPYRSLKKCNTNEKGEPIFGIYLRPLNQGIIRLGDKVDILS